MTDSEFAKTHLRDHLSSLIVPHISEGFWSIFASAKELSERNEQRDQTLRTFQNMLTKVPEWSDSTLSTEVSRIQKITKCTYLDDLIMGVFVAYMKSFANLQYSGSAKEIQIDFERPSLAKFVHELYIHSARKLWQTAYLFKDTGISSELQARNRQEIETIVSQCLEQVIRSFLPWESIAKKYFSTQSHEQDILKPVEDVEPDVQVKKQISFETETSESEEEDDTPPKLMISEEAASINVEEFKEEDYMKDLENKISETLVLNL